jgi:hypothetical protein
LPGAHSERVDRFNRPSTISLSPTEPLLSDRTVSTQPLSLSTQFFERLSPPQSSGVEEAFDHAGKFHFPELTNRSIVSGIQTLPSPVSGYPLLNRNRPDTLHTWAALRLGRPNTLDGAPKSSGSGKKQRVRF